MDEPIALAIARRALFIARWGNIYADYRHHERDENIAYVEPRGECASWPAYIYAVNYVSHDIAGTAVDFSVTNRRFTLATLAWNIFQFGISTC